MLNGKPVIGALHGYAVGGGFEWLLNCDLVVAADDLVAFFPEMAIGPVRHRRRHLPAAARRRPPAGHGADDARRAPDRRRLEALGLVGWVVPREEMLPKALAVAGQVAANRATRSAS